MKEGSAISIVSADRTTRFEELASSVADALRRYALRRTDPDTAEDVVAETLLVLWRRIDGVPADPESAVAWCYGVARGCLANANRAARRQWNLFNRIRRLDPPAWHTATDADHSLVHEALARLSEADQEVLRLWVWEDLTTSQIAQVLNISGNAAAIRLHRARTKLQSALARTERGMDQ